MNTRKCNKCGKILTKQDDYYTIDEVTFNKGKPNKHTTRLILSDEEKEACYETNESWVTYTDIDFCPECFNMEWLKEYLK